MREEDVTRILQTHVVLNKDPIAGTQELLRLPGIQRYLRSLSTMDEREHFQKHLRKYVNIYLPDCPFEVSTTNRYEITTSEASAVARKNIKKGDIIRYLSGIQVAMTKEEEEDLDVMKRDFSIVMSSRKKTPSLFLGPARFANHDCDANARLSTTGAHGMQIVSVKDIEIGDEITVTYGEDYFGEDNCECLCATCERMLRNGWDPTKEAEDSDDEDASPEAEAEAGAERETENTISPKPETEPYSLRRQKRKFTFDPETHTPVLTPEATPPRPSKRQKVSESGAASPITPPAAIPQIIKTEPGASGLRNETTTDSTREPSPFAAFLPSFIRKGLKKSASKVNGYRFITYGKRSRKSNLTSDYDTPRSNSPVSSTMDGSQMSSLSTDLTSVGDMTEVGAELQPIATCESEHFTDAKETQHSPDTEAGALRNANLEIDGDASMVTAIEDTPAVVASDSTTTVILEQGEYDSDLSELSSSLEIDDTMQQIVKRRYKRKILTRQSSRNLKNLPIPTIESAADSADSSSGSGIPRRRPGDYTLTRRLLPTIYSRWVECQNCDDPFVQHDAFLTRINCPRCERHSKLYGYAWPKTDREGKHDKEERVLDHRTVNRFVAPDEERSTRKGRKTLKTLIVDRERSLRESTSVSAEPESRKRKRARRSES